tara:strand:- start:40 stop:357 length:318 start_codon:yes stop_codon:yes gene_type:complete
MKNILLISSMMVFLFIQQTVQAQFELPPDHDVRIEINMLLLNDRVEEAEKLLEKLTEKSYQEFLIPFLYAYSNSENCEKLAEFIKKIKDDKIRSSWETNYKWTCS